MDRLDSKLHITLDPDQDAYLPGDTITLDVRIEAEESIAVRSGRVEVVARQRYRYQIREWDRHDDRYETKTKTETEEWMLTDSILGQETLTSGHPIERRVRFRIPSDAAPSGAGEIVQVAWEARATVDVPRRRDATVIRPLTVLIPQSEHASRADAAPIVAGDAAHLVLDTATRHTIPGQTLEGTLTVDAREEFTIRSARIELIRQEETFRELGFRSEEIVVEQEIADGFDFLVGHHREFPFSITIPAHASPCRDTRLYSVSWFLRAVLNRTLRGDQQITVELNVYTADATD